MRIVSDSSGNYLSIFSSSLKPDLSAVTTDTAFDMAGLLEKKSRRCARTGDIAWGTALVAFIPTLLSYFHMVSEYPATATVGAAIGTGVILTSLYVMNTAEEKKREAEYALRKIKDAENPARKGRTGPLTAPRAA